MSTVKHGDVHGCVMSVAPKFTSVAPVKFVPPRTTLLPPVVNPVDGVRLVNVGVGVTYVYVTGCRRAHWRFHVDGDCRPQTCARHAVTVIW